jgi:hypothetical protein
LAGLQKSTRMIHPEISAGGSAQGSLYAMIERALAIRSGSALQRRLGGRPMQWVHWTLRMYAGWQGGLSPFLFGLLLVAGVDLSVFGEAAAHHEFGAVWM